MSAAKSCGSLTARAFCACASSLRVDDTQVFAARSFRCSLKAHRRACPFEHDNRNARPTTRTKTV